MTRSEDDKVTRLAWEALPAERVAAVEERIGPVIKAEEAGSGLMPGLAATLHAEGGRYFVKAAPADSPARDLYEREIAAGQSLPPGVPAPRLLLASDGGGWLLMVFEHAGGHDADLSPGSADLPAVSGTVQAIGAARAWDGAPPVAANVAALQDKASRLLASHPDGPPWDMYAAAISDFDSGWLAGTSLVHYDLHSANLQVDAGGTAKALDWSFACSGAPWVDFALLLPRLIEAGHTPADAEQFAAQLPAWKCAPPRAVTALAALWSLFREYKAHYGPRHARGIRAQAAEAGRAWVAHRMG